MPKKTFVATATIMAFGSGLYYYQQEQAPYDATPGDSFIAEDGTAWNKMKGDDLQMLFGPDAQSNPVPKHY